MKIDEPTIFENDFSYNLYSEISLGFWRFSSRSNKTGNPGQLWRNTKQFQWQHHTYRFNFFLSGGAKLFDPPSMTIIFLDPPFLVNYFHSIPPFPPAPPCEVKNDNSLNRTITTDNRTMATQKSNC